ncbi:type II toxin-antitoxin system RelE/ParE family toxin [Acetobacterium paludosum]|uniref:Type II toxin-antitoxin system RelE/ParE family toxin n=1 Tax=Acetobacterium paludosum TaxID=52693 RepID=A0A923HR97_9FIRM|nr:type II toxin-antitoxin system RelE/ParE family toxin [Acetobacterium paludosum]MBC3887243.1 type II toxin-antitoxin system RelE/ParE family toxin [Acetobacterium paludosum]
MHEILFYKDPKGNEPVLDFIRELSRKNDKDSRVNLNKINDYIQMLSKYGTKIGEPYIKHLEGEIWELRPLRSRIFFVAWVDGSYVLLHQFIKKSQKTPKRELEQARRELSILTGRGENNE